MVQKNGFCRGKGKKNLIIKTWERCLLIHGGHALSKSKTRKSSKDDLKKCQLVASQGCFSVYVGTEKQRFVIKTEYANHPLFKMLLEDAELEYGFNSEGPILLPCDVNLFYEVLAEMDSKEIHYGFAYGTCSPLNPSRCLASS